MFLDFSSLEMSHSASSDESSASDMEVVGFGRNPSQFEPKFAGEMRLQTRVTAKPDQAVAVKMKTHA